MIEVVLKNFLDGMLDVPSFFEHEPDMPESYVILEKTGGGGSDYVHSATIAFHHNSDYNFTDTDTKQYRYQAVYDINYF
mgnify:CR=1 FL=1